MPFHCREREREREKEGERERERKRKREGEREREREKVCMYICDISEVQKYVPKNDSLFIFSFLSIEGTHTFIIHNTFSTISF